jgi:DNA invertase Pin-like site-specific DNA recombinase
MKQSTTWANSPVEPYHHILDYKIGMDLPDKITVLYNRLSRDDKDKEREDDSNSIINQKKMLAKFACDKKLINPVFFTDDGISGTTFERADFQAAMELAENGRVESFVVKDMSRFGRDHIRVGLYKEMLTDELNVRFIAINDDEDSKYGENEMTPFRNIVNEWYARDTSKKIRAVFKAKCMAGEPMSKTPPYGYMKNPDNPKRWIVDEAAAEVVRRIYRLCVSGMRPTCIANLLCHEKVEKPSVHMHKTGIKAKGNAKRSLFMGYSHSC